MKKLKLPNNIWIWCALALPAVIVLALILYIGANAPVWDDYGILKLYQGLVEGQKGITDILQFQINEHKAIVPTIIEMVIWALTNCNQLIVSIISLLFVVGVLITIVLYWKKRGLPLAFMLPISVLLFSFRQSNVHFWTPCFVYTCYALFCVLCFFFFNKAYDNKKIKFLILAILFGIFTTYSFTSGLLIWISYLILFVTQRVFENKKFFTRWNLIILITGITCWILYLWNWDRSMNSQLAAHNVLDIFLCLVYMVGNPFFNIDNSMLAYLFGSIVLAVTFVLLVTICLKKKISEFIFPILLTMLSFGGMALIAFGRAGSEGGYAAIGLSGQYTTSSTLFLISVYLLAAKYILDILEEKSVRLTEVMKNSISGILYITCFFISLFYFNTEGIYWMERSIAGSYTLQNYDIIPEQIYKDCSNPFGKQTKYLDWIRENNLFLFAGTKQYKYPYDGFVLTKEIPEISLPEILIDASDCWIDTVNGKPLDSGKVTTTAEEGIDVSGWALDEKNTDVPSTVYLEIDDRYYQLSSFSRPDVAQTYGSEKYTDSGIRGFIPLSDYVDGTYQVNLVSFLSDGNSYYTAHVFDLEITN